MAMEARHAWHMLQQPAKLPAGGHGMSLNGHTKPVSEVENGY